MKSGLQKVLAVIFIVAFFGYFIGTAIIDLTNKDDVHEFVAVGGFELFEMDNSINGIIPIGTDHYYLVFDEEYNGYIVKGSHKWYDKNFDSEGETLDANGFELKGLAKRPMSFDLREGLASCTAKLTGINYPAGAGNIIYMSYVSAAIGKLLLMLAVIALIVIYSVFLKNGNAGSGVKKVFLVITIVVFFLLLRFVLI